MTSEALLAIAIEKGTITGICIFALWIVSKRLFRSHDEAMLAAESRFKSLEKRSDECEKDRRAIHSEFAKLQFILFDKLSKLLTDKTDEPGPK